ATAAAAPRSSGSTACPCRASGSNPAVPACRAPGRPAPARTCRSAATATAPLPSPSRDVVQVSGLRDLDATARRDLARPRRLPAVAPADRADPRVRLPEPVVERLVHRGRQRDTLGVGQLAQRDIAGH